MSDTSLPYTDTSTSQTQTPWAFVLPTILLALLPLAYAGILTWQEYLRLAVIAAGLGAYARFWPLEGRYAQDVIALGLIFIVTQFDPATSARAEIVPAAPLNPAFVISSVLAMVLFAGFLFSRQPWGPFCIVDWVAGGVMAIALGLVTGAHLFFDNPMPWNSIGKFVVYGLLYVSVTRRRSAARVLERRLLYGMSAVFAVVCLVGAFRIGTALYYHRAAQQAEDLQTAVAHFETAADLARVLRMDGLRDASVFGKAERLYRQGDAAGAAQTLSMADGFVISVPPNAWEGPAGGMLYTNLSCWKDCILYEGQVEVRIFARGRQALKIWPLMQVRLGGRLLGEVAVDSPEVRPYVFEVPVDAGRQRLEVSFTNDYFNPPEDRNLWVEQAEIRYLDIAWR